MTTLDGRRFRMLSSTASRVDPDAPTVFDYHEADGVVWGEYTGDTVTTGRFVGTRSGAALEVAFVHALVAGGSPVSGRSASRIETDRDARLRLVEDFRIGEEDHRSICIEERA